MCHPRNDLLLVRGTARPAEGSRETRDLGSDSPSCFGKQVEPLLPAARHAALSVLRAQPPCPAPFPTGGPPRVGFAVSATLFRGCSQTATTASSLTAHEGKTHSKCSSVDTICCFSNATYFSKQVILSMIMSLTKCKVLDGMQPCLFWKQAALSGPGTGTGPRTRNHDHARSHEWGEARGEWKRTDTFSFTEDLKQQ